MTKLNFLISCLLLLTVSCGQPKTTVPSDVLSKEKMIEVLTDIRLAEANARVARQMQQFEEHMLDSSYFVIYKIHGITVEELSRSMDYYGKRLELMMEIDEKVLENLNLIN